MASDRQRDTARQAHPETDPRLARLLEELATADRRAARPNLWPAVEQRLHRPRLADRLPSPLAAAARLGGDLLQPAALAGAAAGVAGLALGGWLALSVWNGPATVQAAGEDYAVSTLVAAPADTLDDGTDFASAWASSFAEAEESADLEESGKDPGAIQHVDPVPQPDANSEPDPTPSPDSEPSASPEPGGDRR